MSDVRPVPVGRSRFSRCCHLIIDLSSISPMEVGARCLSQSPELGGPLQITRRGVAASIPGGGQAVHVWVLLGYILSLAPSHSCRFVNPLISLFQERIGSGQVEMKGWLS
jgi:hypothetical protein